MPEGLATFRVSAARAMLSVAVLSTTGMPPLSSRHVTIEAVDYAYRAPATVPPGPTVFTFVNHGRVPHEMQLFRFNPDISAAMARRYLATGIVPDSVADNSGGVLIAPPGGRTREGLYVELVAGEQYALMCQFRDSAGKPMHSTIGMAALVQVR
jgi:hypothetical protein